MLKKLNAQPIYVKNLSSPPIPPTLDELKKFIGFVLGVQKFNRYQKFVDLWVIIPLAIDFYS